MLAAARTLARRFARREHSRLAPPARVEREGAAPEAAHEEGRGADTDGEEVHVEHGTISISGVCAVARLSVDALLARRQILEGDRQPPGARLVLLGRGDPLA